jgi:hypothetical protein
VLSREGKDSPPHPKKYPQYYKALSENNLNVLLVFFPPAFVVVALDSPAICGSFASAGEKNPAQSVHFIFRQCLTAETF